MSNNQVNYETLLNHWGHKVEITVYGDCVAPNKVCLECIDCNKIVLETKIIHTEWESKRQK